MHAALQQVLLRQGDLKAARADLATARTTLPDPVLACFEVRSRRRAGARRLQRRASNDAAGPGLPGRRGRRDRTAVVDADAVGALASGMGIEAVVLIAQAVDRMNAGDASAARDVLDRLLEMQPHRTDARLLRGRVRQPRRSSEHDRT